MAPNLDIDDDAPPSRKKAKLVDNAPKIHCRICYSELTDEEPWVVPCRTCKKPTCFECVKGQWLAALSDHERMPVRCCQKVVYHDAAKDILPPTELAIYKLRFDEASTPNPFYCPVPTCSTFIPPRLLKPVRGKITCHICATISCVKCKQPASDEHNCLNTDEKTAILKSFNYKLCPKCGTGIMRMYGCAHVRCQCGAHWCWDCQRPINACYTKPCSAARDDGQNSEPDDADSESDEGAATSITDAVPAPNANELASVATVTQTDSQAGASNTRTHGPPLATTVVVEIVEEAPLVTNNNPVGVSLEEQSLPQETVLNLDDPENPDHDWEGEDFDFGEEPNDEYWDVWGCMHRFKDFTAEDMPDRWLANIDTSKITAIECMGCFKTINVGPLKPLGPQTPGEWEAEQQDQSARGLDGAAEADAKLARKQKRRAQKTGAFECRECGVIHCWWCKRMAVRQMSKYRKGAIV